MIACFTLDTVSCSAIRLTLQAQYTNIHKNSPAPFLTANAGTRGTLVMLPLATLTITLSLPVPQNVTSWKPTQISTLSCSSKRRTFPALNTPMKASLFFTPLTLGMSWVRILLRYVVLPVAFIPSYLSPFSGRTRSFSSASGLR